MSKTICFTGRRPKDLCGYTESAYTNLVNYVTDLCESYIKQGYDTFITGGAQGFDQLAFWAIHNLKQRGYTIKNIVYVPFKGQESAWLKDGMFSRNQYNLMLALADDVIYLQDQLSERNAVVKALYDRNHAMIDASDLCIALYPTDDYMDSKGGTAECMRYAISHNCKIHQIKYEICNHHIVPIIG